ncbi:MAG: hypothetical protein P4L99_24200 [Chthoniobacter sp.]|nr:hypothetical protein [Chthoniobacter sp.]
MARYLSGPTQPLGKWNNIPIYLTTILTAVFVAGLIGTALLTAARSLLLEAFVFSMPLRPAWTLWRLFTYVFVSPVNFFTPFAILCFYWFAVGIETHLGRVVVSRLLILLVLVPPAVGAFCWWVLGVPSGVADNYLLTSGLLVAFATLYPTTEAWGWIPFKWIAFACIFSGSLMLLSSHDWLGIAELWISCAVGFGYIRHAKDLEYEDYVSPVARVQQLFRRKPKFRVVPAPSNASYREAMNEPESELDVLLDKIAKSGMSSLTAKEKATLEKAREALMRKDQR